MKQFKFFNNTKARNRVANRIVRNGRPTYNYFSYPDNDYLGGEMNYIFIWSVNDTRSNEYRLGIFQGAIKHFSRTYDDAIIEDNEIMYLIPCIESINLIVNGINVPVNSNYAFDDPDEIVVIFYKIYTNDF